MKRTPKNIQKILTSYFVFIMLILLVFATVIFSIVQYMNLRSNTERDIQRTCAAIAEDIDLQLSQMDAVCLNTIHSTLIKETFDEYINAPEENSREQILRRNTLASTLTSIKGVDSTIRQTNVYSFTKGGFGTGNYMGPLDVIATEQDWYAKTFALSGKCYIPPARKNERLSISSGTDKDRYYMSLFHMYYDEFHNPTGFVEVMKYYDILFDRAYHPDSNYDIDVIIYDKDGNVLFPLSEGAQDLFHYYPLRDSGEKELYNTEKKQREYVYFSDMDYSNCTAVTTIRSTEFFAPIYRSLFWTIFIFLLVLLMCLFFASMLAGKLSAPLNEIYRFLSHIDPHNQFREIKMEDSGVIEIDKLRDSLNEAMRAQKVSTDSMMLLQKQELQAQMLALQSQMNPHFLYNSLNTIGAMAEEGMTEPVSQMCRDITSILRYISSNQEQVSSLEEELEHCDLYLKCMKLRFGDALHYEFDVDDDMLELPIPKLCIQLLVENAVKFTANTSPPWHITIYGHVDENCWFIEVKDNGPGFSKEITAQLKAQMDDILKYRVLPSLKLDGMGVLNIFLRFYLIYGISFMFDFGNLPEGGAIVIVGGRFDEENQPL